MEKIVPNEENRRVLSLIWNRAQLSRRKCLVEDPKAEEIAERIDGSSLSFRKYLSVFLGVRAGVIDDIAEKYLEQHPDATVLHLGCGLDTRYDRLHNKGSVWYDLDFPEVIALRRNFYEETETYHMIGSDVSDLEWLDAVEGGGTGLIIAEGLSMFLTAEENIELFASFRNKFQYSEYVFDVYTDRTVVYSMKNETPVRGKTVVWGLSKPGLMQEIGGVKFMRAYSFKRTSGMHTLGLGTRIVYRMLYGKGSTKRLYQIYRYKLSRDLSLLEDS